jgi:hypothetical protein
MSWPSIPPSIPHWLRRHPLALTAAIASMNRLQRLVTARRGRAVLVIVAVTLLGALLVTLLASAGGAALAMQQALATLGSSLPLRSVCSVADLETQSRGELAPCAIVADRYTAGDRRVQCDNCSVDDLPLLWRLAVAVACVHPGVSARR